MADYEASDYGHSNRASCRARTLLQANLLTQPFASGMPKAAELVQRSKADGATRPAQYKPYIGTMEWENIRQFRVTPRASLLLTCPE